MKKLLSFFLAVLLLALVGCGEPAVQTQPTVATTMPTEEDDPMVNDLTDRFVSEPGAMLPAEQTYSLKKGDIPEFKNGQLALLSLEVKADKGVKALTVALYQGGVQAEDTYYVGEGWSRIVLCSDPAGSPVGIKLAAQEGICLRKLTLKNMQSQTPETVGHMLGQYLLEDFETYALPEEGVGAGPAKDLVCNGDFIYSVGSGMFTVTDISNPDAPRVRGSISNLGNTRQMALCESGTDVMVTARGFGAYIIDASNPDAPRLRCSYDTLEMGTGICISGNYAYIANRQYGVEVVDISDLDAPRYLTTLPTGEVQSCQIFEGKLYCGLYGEHRVDIYDLTAAEPTLVGKVELKGRGDGLAVAKQDDRVLLYAATGHHSVKRLPNNSPITDPRYGQGNGLDIIDVTDPANPQWLSTVRSDGRFYHTANDFWEASLSEYDGHRYVQLVNTYNGVYIYNVDDPTSPQRVAHITVPIAQNSNNYVYYRQNIHTLIFPFDRETMLQSPAGAVVCKDGVLYMAGVLTDVHAVKLSQLGQSLTQQSSQVTLQPAKPGQSCRFDPEGQVHSVITDGQRFYVACGTDGLAVLDRGLSLEAMHPTKDTCYDVKLFENTLYVAEGRAGLAAYDRSTLQELWRYAPEGKVIKQVTLSPKGRFAVLHSGDTEASVVRLEDQMEVYSRRTSSQMYHHNVSATVIGGRYINFWAQATNEVWLDFGPEDDRSSPTEVIEYKSRTPMQGGTADLNGQALTIVNGGYLLYDPTGVEDMASLPSIGLCSGSAGKPTVAGNRLVVCDRTYSKVYIADISNPQSPQLLLEQTVSGNPDTALVAFGNVYIPAGHGGLLCIPMP